MGPTQRQQGNGIMWKWVFILTGSVLLGACGDDDTILVPVDGPAPPLGWTPVITIGP